MRGTLPPAVLLGLAVACAPPADSPRSLVLIVIDTLRSDRIGAAGYVPAVTPTLDSLATNGVRFAQAMSTAPVTCPAVATLLTGRLPFEHGLRDNEYFTLPQSEVTLAERFRDAGFRTAAVLGSAVLDADRGLDQGFEIYDDAFEGTYPIYDPSLAATPELGDTRRRADRVTDLALRAVERFGDDRFFVLAHYFDVHAYYDPPPAFATLHPERPYDAEVSFVDAEIGRLLRAVPNDALVVVVSDHGESQGEHGEPQHGFLVYDCTLRVPFLAAGAGAARGVVRNDPVSLTDVEPSLAEVFGLRKVDSPRSGRALGFGPGELPPVDLYAETMRTLVSYGWSELRAIRRGSTKVIVGGGVVETYDLNADPDELRDLGEAAAPVEMLERLEDWTAHDDVEAVVDASRHGVDEARRERLISLGYASARSESRDRPHPRTALPEWSKFQAGKKALLAAASRIAGGDFAGAIASADECLVFMPRNAQAIYMRGYARQALGEAEAARSDYESAVAFDSTHVGALAALASLDDREGRTDRARRGWEAVLRHDPRNEFALRALGRAEGR